MLVLLFIKKVMGFKIVLSFFVFVTAMFSSVAQNSPPSISADQGGLFCAGSLMPIASNVSITDSDSGDTTLNTVVVQVSQGYVSGQDLLSLSIAQPNITSSWNASQGELTLSGTATFLEYETALEAVAFQTTQINFTEDKFFSINIGEASYLPSTGHYYFYVSDIGITWNEAKVAAENQTFFGLQGYLATITTEEESQLAGEQSPGTGWIGASDAQTEGTWKWVTGPEAGDVIWIGEQNGSAQNGAFTFWNSSEPNNFGNEDYAHITDPSVGQTGSWNDLGNEGDAFGSPYHPKGYLVEFGGFSGEPNINLSTSTSIKTPRVLTVINGESCGVGVVNLSVTSTTDSAIWFETETSTTILNTGLSFSQNITATTSFWVLPVYSGCSSIVGERKEVNAVINEFPDAFNVSIFQCDDSVISDGLSLFNMNFYFLDITGGETTNRDINYFANAALTQPISGDNYANVVTPQTVYAQVVNTVTSCASVSAITLEVNTNAVNDTTLATCDQNNNEGFAEFNLSDADINVLNGLPAGLTLAYYETFNDALLQNNPLSNNYSNIIAFNQTIYVRVLDADTCYGIAEVALVVDGLPINEPDETVFYCLNSFPDTITLSVGVVNSNFSYNWSTGETSQFIQVNETGMYTVEVTNNTTLCSNVKNFTVEASNVATIESVAVVDVSQNNSITINVSGEGVYQYALSSFGPFQNENVFNNLPAGIYEVFVRDVKNNCGTTAEMVSVLGYPNYFTPNDDSFNDTWQLTGVANNFNANFRLSIYNRFGKLLFTTNDPRESWNGTFNGSRLPTSDYWFTAFLGNGKSFKGHFTLKIN